MMLQLKATICLQVLGATIFSLLYILGYLGVEWYKKYESEPNLKKTW